MVNPVITNVDIGNGVIVRGPMRDELLTFAGAGTVLHMSLVARDTTTDKLVPYVKAGVTQGNGVVHGIITTGDVVAAGAGDVPVRLMQSGEVILERIIIDADGDNSNVDFVEVDGLRDRLITSKSHQDLSVLDNQ